MAETTNPRTARARTSTAKPAAAKAAAAPVAETAAKPTEVTRFKVELERGEPTKSYEKFNAPANLKGTFVGSLYAPLGTERIVVMVIGAGDNGDD